MKQDEKLKLRDRYQTMGVEIPVAKLVTALPFDGSRRSIHPLQRSEKK